MVKAVKVMNWVYRKLERPEVGVVKVRCGKIKLGQELMKDKRTRGCMEIPCRNVREEVEGYRAIRDLDQILGKVNQKKLMSYGEIQ